MLNRILSAKLHLNKTIATIRKMENSITLEIILIAIMEHRTIKRTCVYTKIPYGKVLEYKAECPQVIQKIAGTKPHARRSNRGIGEISGIRGTDRCL